MYPESIHMKDKNGRIPIHLISSSNNEPQHTNGNNFLRLYFMTLIRERDIEILSLQNENLQLAGKIKEYNHKISVERDQRTSKATNRVVELEQLLSQVRAKRTTLELELKVKTDLAYSLYNELSCLKANLSDDDDESFVDDDEVRNAANEIIEQQELRTEHEKLGEKHKDLVILYKKEKNMNAKKISLLEERLKKKERQCEEMIVKNAEIEKNTQIKEDKMKQSLQAIFTKSIHVSTNKSSTDIYRDPFDFLTADITKDERESGYEEMKEKYDVLTIMYQQEKKSYKEKIVVLQEDLRQKHSENIKMEADHTKIREQLKSEVDKERTQSKKLCEKIETQKTEIVDLIQKREDIECKNENLVLESRSTKNLLDEQIGIGVGLRASLSEYSNYVEDLLSEIQSIKEMSDDACEQKMDCSVTKIDLRVKAALLNLTYLRAKCRDMNAITEDYKILRQDMDKVLRYVFR